jgi:glyoxylate reductase
VANTPYAVSDATADMGITLMLCALRGVNERQANARAGKWRLGMGLAEDPAGKTIGFLGMGEGAWYEASGGR